jgi:hypothetical protein
MSRPRLYETRHWRDKMSTNVEQFRTASLLRMRTGSVMVKVMEQCDVDRSRRGFLLKAAYVAPLVVTLSVMPSIASAGSVATPSSTDQARASRSKQHKNNDNHWSPW